MIVVDTNVIYELVKARPNEAVLDWLDDNESELYLTVITVEEMRFGALCLPEGKRKRALSESIDTLVSSYAHRLLTFDSNAAEQCAAYHHMAIEAGRSPSIEDLMIAAICTCNNATLATRNVRDFAYLGIPIENPFAPDESPTFE